MAIRPFHVSADRVHPHCHTRTGGGKTLRSRSYVSRRASTSPNGTRESARGLIVPGMDPTYGNASNTASAKSSINVGLVFNAGTRPQSLIPHSSASSLQFNTRNFKFECIDYNPKRLVSIPQQNPHLYSTSISSKVSMCSDTKLIGTANMLLMPRCPK